MVRTNQGGSILNFAIIGVVMALLLVGGAYFVRHNLSAVADEVPGVVDDGSTSEEETTDTEDEGLATGEDETNQPSEESDTDTTSDDETTDDTDNTVEDDTQEDSAVTGTTPENSLYLFGLYSHLASK